MICQRLLLMCILAVSLVSRAIGGDGIPPAIPSNARLIARVNIGAAASAPIVRQHAEQIAKLFDGSQSLLAEWGIDAPKIDQIWLSLGDDYPSGSCIVLNGDIDAARVAEKMKQHVRERKYSARAIQENSVSAVQYELPIQLCIIPGIPNSIILGAASKSGAIASFDAKTLFASLGRMRSGAAEQLTYLESTGQGINGVETAAIAFSPPEALCGPGSMLAGIRSIQATVKLTAQASIAVKIQCLDTAAGRDVSERARSALTQIGKLFGPLAAQQNLDPRWNRLIGQICSAAKIDLRDSIVTIDAELSSDAVRTILEK